MLDLVADLSARAEVLGRSLHPHTAARWRKRTRRARPNRDGRGNLLLKGLTLFSTWFLRVCLDQVDYMAGLFDLDTLAGRLSRYVVQSETLAPEAARLLHEALIRGEFARGEASRSTGLRETSARRVLRGLTGEGLLASDTEKGPVSLRFPAHRLETLFPRLYPEMG